MVLVHAGLETGIDGFTIIIPKGQRVLTKAGLVLGLAIFSNASIVALRASSFYALPQHLILFKGCRAGIAQAEQRTAQPFSTHVEFQRVCIERAAGMASGRYQQHKAGGGRERRCVLGARLVLLFP